MNIKKVFPIVLLLLLIFSAFSANAQDEGTAYRIGFIASITGGASSLGVPERNTAEMWKAQLEEEGITDANDVHHDVEVIILDSESNPDTAASAVSRLIEEENVDVLIAGTTSGNSLAMLPIATEAGVPMISMASAEAIIKDEDGNTREWIFKIPPVNLYYAQWQVGYLQTQDVTSLCYLYENTGYGQDTLVQTEVAIADIDMEIVYSDTFERGDTEFPQALSIISSGCEALIIGALPPTAAVAQAAVQELEPDFLVIQGGGTCNQALIDAAPDYIEGTPVSCSRMLVVDTLPEDDPQREAILAYREAYEESTGGESISDFGGYANDAFLWVVSALENLEDGGELADRRSAIRDHFETGIEDLVGTTATFTTSEDNHLGYDYTAQVMVIVQDGGYIHFPEEDWGME